MHVWETAAILLVVVVGLGEGGTPFASTYQADGVDWLPGNLFDGYVSSQWRTPDYPSRQFVGPLYIGYDYGVGTTVYRYGMTFSAGHSLLERTPRSWTLVGSGGACGAGVTLDSQTGVDVRRWESGRITDRFYRVNFAVPSPRPCSRYQLNIETVNFYDPNGADWVTKALQLGEMTLDKGCPTTQVTCWNGAIRQSDPHCNLPACPPCPVPSVQCHAFPYADVFAPTDPTNGCRYTCPPATRCHNDYRYCPTSQWIVFRELHLACNFPPCPSEPGSPPGPVIDPPH